MKEGFTVALFITGSALDCGGWGGSVRENKLITVDAKSPVVGRRSALAAPAAVGTFVPFAAATTAALAGQHEFCLLVSWPFTANWRDKTSPEEALKGAQV